MGSHTLVIPRGALRKQTTITAEQMTGRTNSLRFSPEGLRFEKPAELTMSYKNCLDRAAAEAHRIHRREAQDPGSAAVARPVQEEDRQRADRPLLPVRGRVLSYVTSNSNPPPGAVGPGDRAPPRWGFFAGCPRATSEPAAWPKPCSVTRLLSKQPNAMASRKILAESLRRLGVVHHHRDQRARARELCERSYQTATEMGDAVLAAEALNALAGFDFEGGAMEAAREKFYRALELGGANAELRGRTEQNLGILANIQGALAEALAHYQRSLQAFESTGDDRGCAIAYHNLGMVSADRELWDDADGYFRRSFEIAERIGDLHLQGLGLLNHAEVHLARQRYDQARQNAETALGIFDQLGSTLDKADAYKVIGRVYRETGRHALAESRLRSAIELAVSTGSILSEAEADRELALLYQAMGRNQEALRLLNAAHRLFGRLDARVDLVDVSTKVRRLEETYFAVVRDWGQSIESSDSYTYGHCERVAELRGGAGPGARAG